MAGGGKRSEINNGLDRPKIRNAPIQRAIPTRITPFRSRVKEASGNVAQAVITHVA